MALELAIRKDKLNGLQIIDFGQDVQLEIWRKLLRGAVGASGDAESNGATPRAGASPPPNDTVNNARQAATPI